MAEENRQYVIMAKAAEKKIRERDPEELALITGGTWDGSVFAIETMGRTIRINWEDMTFEPETEMWHSLSILQFLSCAQKTQVTDGYISLKDFSSGGLIRGTSFDKENERIIEEIGEYPGERIRKAAASLGGIEMKEGTADITFLFRYLPTVPMKVSIWMPDDEFKAAGKVLVPQSVESSMQIEAAGTAAGILLTTLKNALK